MNSPLKSEYPHRPYWTEPPQRYGLTAREDRPSWLQLVNEEPRLLALIRFARRLDKAGYCLVDIVFACEAPQNLLVGQWTQRRIPPLLATSESWDTTRCKILSAIDDCPSSCDGCPRKALGQSRLRPAQGELRHFIPDELLPLLEADDASFNRLLDTTGHIIDGTDEPMTSCPAADVMTSSDVMTSYPLTH